MDYTSCFRIVESLSAIEFREEKTSGDSFTTSIADSVAGFVMDPKLGWGRSGAGRLSMREEMVKQTTRSSVVHILLGSCPCGVGEIYVEVESPVLDLGLRSDPVASSTTESVCLSSMEPAPPLSLSLFRA